MKPSINISKFLAAVTLAAVALTGAIGTMAMTGSNTDMTSQYPDDEDTTFFMRYLPGEIRDTTAFKEEQLSRQDIDLTAKINLLTRCYGDSVVLRWQPTTT